MKTLNKNGNIKQTSWNSSCLIYTKVKMN